MENLFLSLLNRSISASWLVIAILLLRLLLKKVPKSLFCILWALVGFRLLCPFSLESALSLIPSAETVPPEILLSPAPEIQSGIPALNEAINPILSQTLAPNAGDSANPVQILAFVSAAVWGLGTALLLLYSLLSCLRIRRKVRESIELEPAVFLCDSIDTPFLFGLFRPRIYLPSSLAEEDRVYVLAHERAHIKRRDYLWKPLGFLLLAIYWFNPILWLAYILLCRDIELACDESVIRQLGESGKKPYSSALINCSIPRRLIIACPLAFGEVGVKQRIRSVLNYKKPAFWVLLLAVLLSIGVAICFLTDPKPNDATESELPGVSLEILALEPDAATPHLTLQWTNDTESNLLLGEEFYIYRQVNGKWKDCRTVDPYYWHAIARLLNANTSVETTHSLSDIDLTQAGSYRFESFVTTQDDPTVRYRIALDFDFTETTALSDEVILKPLALVYDCGLYSYTQLAEDAPTYRLVNRTDLQEISPNYTETYHATMRSVSLNNDTFDSRFVTDELWLENESVESLKAENKYLWEFADGENLYLLLEQTDGTYYLAVGYRDQKNKSFNDDRSLIRWVYRVSKEVKPLYEKKNSLFGSLESQEHFPMIEDLSFGMTVEEFLIARPEAVDYSLSGNVYTDTYYDKALQANVTVSYTFRADSLDEINILALAESGTTEEFAKCVASVCKQQNSGVFKILENNSHTTVEEALLGERAETIYILTADREGYCRISYPRDSQNPRFALTLHRYTPIV